MLILCPGVIVRPAAAASPVSLIHDLPRTTEALFDVTRGAAILPSAQIELIAQPLVEYAQRWPVRIVNRVAQASWMALLIEQNPQPLAAVFQLRSAGLSEIGTTIRIMDTTQVTVIVAAAGRLYGTRRLVTVVGNCM